MRTYETVFIYDPRISEEERKKITEKIEGIIKSSGTLYETNFWGKKRFAYPIQKSTEGYYYLFVFDAPPSVPAELKRITAITETIFRSMTIARKYRYTPQEEKEEPAPVPVSEPKPESPPETIAEQDPAIPQESEPLPEFIPEEKQEEPNA